MQAAADGNTHVVTGTFARLTLSNLRKGSSNYWCGPLAAPVPGGDLSGTCSANGCTDASTSGTPNLFPNFDQPIPGARNSLYLGQCSCKMHTHENRSGSAYALRRRVAFGFVYVATGYVCWLLVKYYQARTSLECHCMAPGATRVLPVCLCTSRAKRHLPLRHTCNLCMGLSVLTYIAAIHTDSHVTLTRCKGL